MNYFCDTCNSPLPFGYVPEVDGRGRPCQAVCWRCKRDQIEDRLERLLHSQIKSLPPRPVQ